MREFQSDKALCIVQIQQFFGDDCPMKKPRHSVMNIHGNQIDQFLQLMQEFQFDKVMYTVEIRK
jgi:hypothetical protein